MCKADVPKHMLTPQNGSEQALEQVRADAFGLSVLVPLGSVCCCYSLLACLLVFVVFATFPSRSGAPPCLFVKL